MDNLTHSAVGLLLGRGINGRRGRPALRSAATWTAVLASNLPDIDLVSRPFFDDAKLGYLVHHRGYTHTLVVALLMSPVAAWLGARIGGQPWKKLDRGDRRELLLISGLGVLLHIGADATNNYGTHPFWPFWSDWIYGDSVFIVEPLLLAALLPFAMMSSVGRGGKIGWGLPLLAVLAASFALPGVPLASSLIVSGLALTLILLQRNMARVGLTAAVSLAVPAVFFAGSMSARAALWPIQEFQSVDEPMVDLSLTPMPATPVCWSFIVQTRSVDWVRLETGVLSLWPDLISATRCGFPPISPSADAPTGPDADTTRQVWGDVARSDLALLRAHAEDCRVRAFLRFARMPAWTADGEALNIGDLRYGLNPETGFAALHLDPAEAPADCSALLAPWIPDPARALEAMLVGE